MQEGEAIFRTYDQLDRFAIHSEASKSVISKEKQALLGLGEPASLLVIEVVSHGKPGKPNYEQFRCGEPVRDYVEKPQEYAKRGIPEFWLVNPSRAVVLIASLAGSACKAAEFRGSDRVQYPTSEALNLTAQRVLSEGEAEKP